MKVNKRNQINLIRDEVGGFSRRRLLFLSVVSYLATIFIAMLLLSLATAQGMRTVIRQHSVAKAMSRQASGSQSQPGQWQAEVSKMRSTMGRLTQRLSLVQRVLSKRLSVSKLIGRLSLALPENSFLDDIVVDTDKQEFQFNVVFAKTGQSQTLNINDILSVWNNDDQLMSQAAPIRSTSTQHKKKGDLFMTVVRFSSQLKKGAL